MLKVKLEVVISNANGNMKVINEDLKMNFKELSRLEKFISRFRKQGQVRAKVDNKTK